MSQNENVPTKARTKLEAKLLSDVKKAGVVTPILYDVDLHDKTILMKEIKGDLVSFYLLIK